MKITNERDILREVRDAVTGQDWTREPFLRVMTPLFESFLQSNKEKDEYGGWCFGITFLNSILADYEPYRDALTSESSDWVFFPEGKTIVHMLSPEKALLKFTYSAFFGIMEYKFGCFGYSIGGT